MRKYVSFSTLILLLLTNMSCDQSKKKEEISKINDTITSKKDLPEKSYTTTDIKNKPTDFVPKSYVVFEKIFGDLDRKSVV